MTSEYRDAWLGGETDPQPVFRDLSPEGVRAADGALVPWPDVAVFAVEFTAQAFPAVRHVYPAGLGVRFYDAEGLPVDLPPERRCGLSQDAKIELQVYPTDWQSFSEWAWRTLREKPQVFARDRIVAGVCLTLADFLPHSHGH